MASKWSEAGEHRQARTGSLPQRGWRLRLLPAGCRLAVLHLRLLPWLLMIIASMLLRGPRLVHLLVRLRLPLLPLVNGMTAGGQGCPLLCRIPILGNG